MTIAYDLVRRNFQSGTSDLLGVFLRKEAAEEQRDLMYAAGIVDTTEYVLEIYSRVLPDSSGIPLIER